MKVEVAGFQTYRQPVQDFVKNNSQTIYLEEKVRDIAEVKIAPKKLVEKNWGITSKTKRFVLGYLPKSVIDKRKIYLEEQMKNNFRELAILFTNNKMVKIQKININFGGFNSERPVKFRFVFYSEKDGLPEELLNFDEIYADISNKDINNQTFTLDVSDRNIWIKNNFFLSAQMLSNDFDGVMRLSLGLSGKALYRRFISKWEKLPMGVCPAINIDVKVEK